MNNEIKAYLKTEAAISGAFNFFINGMAAALIYHKADSVSVDLVSLAIDLFITCTSICMLTAFFSKASLKRTKTCGILAGGGRPIRLLNHLFRHTFLFSVLAGLISATVIFALAASFSTLLAITDIPFGVYITLKCIFTALLGGGITACELYLGMVA
ncbi:MAG: hypothetical protein FWH35_05310 [Treponema sp.]|nr:hypothetical protein [Treponema sp.]